MKTTCERDALREGVKLAKRLLKKNPPLPVLDMFLLSAVDGGLELRATNLEVTLQVRMPAGHSDGGEVLLPGRWLEKTLQVLDKGELEISRESITAHLKSNGTNYTIPSLAPDEFPPIAAPEGNPAELRITAADLKWFLEKTIPAVSYDETRYFLNGVYFEVEGGRLVAVGTNGRQMVEAKRGLIQTAEIEDGVIVPTVAVKLVKELAKGKKVCGTS